MAGEKDSPKRAESRKGRIGWAESHIASENINLIRRLCQAEKSRVRGSEKGREREGNKTVLVSRARVRGSCSWTLVKAVIVAVIDRIRANHVQLVTLPRFENSRNVDKLQVSVAIVSEGSEICLCGEAYDFYLGAILDSLLGPLKETSGNILRKVVFPTVVTDVSGDTFENNSRFIPLEGHCGFAWMSLPLLTDETFHYGFLVLKSSDH
jgi:hypothetical protein